MKNVIANWYDNTLRGTVDQQSEAVRKQVEAAFKAAPASAEEVDAWFDEHFKKPPVSHHTPVYNQLHAAAAELKQVFAVERA